MLAQARQPGRCKPFGAAKSSGARASAAPCQRSGAQARPLRLVRLQAQQEEGTTQKTAEQQQQQQPPQQPGQPPEELPIWVRREKERELQAAATKGELPWPLYLLFSSFVAIASVGSVFEYFDRNALFGVIQPDSPLWAPILGLFAITGLPTAGFLFFKGVNAANEAAERADRMDGYIK